MPIIDVKGWEKCVANNQDPYGAAVVAVARRVMEILDAEPGDFDPHALICRADKETEAGGITGYMAGAAASIIANAHSRGSEFRGKWNALFGVKSDKGTVNPAILTISEKPHA